MKKFLYTVDGYKTYAIAIAMLVHAVIITGWQGNNWAGAWIEIREAGVVIGIRSALAKI